MILKLLWKLNLPDLYITVLDSSEACWIFSVNFVSTFPSCQIVSFPVRQISGC
jgi:hypothetical protein